MRVEWGKVQANFPVFERKRFAVFLQASPARPIVMYGHEPIFLNPFFLDPVGVRLIQNSALLCSYEPLRVRKINAHALCEFLRNDPGVLAVYDGCCHYSNQEALKVLRSICECCEHLLFLLFGDASISFWYELIFKGRHVRRYEKTINNTGMNHLKRSEVLFACLPGER